MMHEHARQLALARWEKPGAKQRMSAAAKAAWQKPDVRERMVTGLAKGRKTWPPEQTAALIALWERRPPDGTPGRSCGVIARILSSRFGASITTGAVQGKVRRLGLKMHIPPAGGAA